MVKKFKMAIIQEYDIIDLGLMKYLLGIQDCQIKGKIFISQEKSLEDQLKKFSMSKCKPLLQSSQMKKLQLKDGFEKVDLLFIEDYSSLIYLTHTKSLKIHESTNELLDLMSLIFYHKWPHKSFPVNNKPKLHFVAKLLRYLQGTRSSKFDTLKEKETNLTGYNNMVGSLDEQKKVHWLSLLLGIKINCMEFKTSKDACTRFS